MKTKKLNILATKGLSKSLYPSFSLSQELNNLLSDPWNCMVVWAIYTEDEVLKPAGSPDCALAECINAYSVGELGQLLIREQGGNPSFPIYQDGKWVSTHKSMWGIHFPFLTEADARAHTLITVLKEKRSQELEDPTYRIYQCVSKSPYSEDARYSALSIHDALRKGLVPWDYKSNSIPKSTCSDVVVSVKTPYRDGQGDQIWEGDVVRILRGACLVGIQEAPMRFFRSNGFIYLRVEDVTKADRGFVLVHTNHTSSRSIQEQTDRVIAGDQLMVGGGVRTALRILLNEGAAKYTRKVGSIYTDPGLIQLTNTEN